MNQPTKWAWTDEEFQAAMVKIAIEISEEEAVTQTPLEFDDGDGLGCMRGLMSGLKIMLVLGLIAWCVAEFCWHI